jgi:hypothetical protein
MDKKYKQSMEHSVVFALLYLIGNNFNQLWNIYNSINILKNIINWYLLLELIFKIKIK